MLNDSRKLETEIISSAYNIQIMLKKEPLYFKKRGNKLTEKNITKLDVLVYSHFPPCYKQGLGVGSFEGMNVFLQSRWPYASPLMENGGMQHLYITGVPNTFTFL